MKIAVFNTKSYDRDFFDRYNNSDHLLLTYFETQLNEKTANLCAGFDGVCVFVNDRVNRDVIEKIWNYGIRLIVLRCAGFNNVDLQAAKEYGVKVARVPAYSPEAVAEHAVALILALNRKTHKAYNRVRENNFSLERLVGFNLSGRTAGVVGTGLIGAAFSRIMMGFGCHVIAFDISPNEKLEEQGITYTTFEDLLKISDIISLHCPLIPETYHMIDHQAYQLMKDGVMLINTSRGGLINTKDTIHALKSGELGYLGIDVYEQEEHIFFKDLSEIIIQDDLISRLMTFPNVLITAHQGFFTAEALKQIILTTLQNISEFIAGEKLTNEVSFKT